MFVKIRIINSTIFIQETNPVIKTILDQAQKPKSIIEMKIYIDGDPDINKTIFLN